MRARGFVVEGAVEHGASNERSLLEELVSGGQATGARTYVI